MSYVLQTGSEGAERLRLLARTKWPTTEALLRRVGFGEGMRCLDVGCGIGEVTLEFARWVGPHGQVTGIDADEGFVAIARQEAARRQLPATFQVGRADDLPADLAADLVYARFLLTHLPEPEKTLAQMKEAARPGGLVIVEDIDFNGHVCYPPCPALRRYLELYSEVARYNGGDACIGPRLPGMFLDAGFEDVQLEVVVPTFRQGEGKRVVPVTMEHIRGAVVAAGLATDQEIDSLVAELESFARNPRTILSMSSVFQVWGRRP